jgi:hypothetical protein
MALLLPLHLLLLPNFHHSTSAVRQHIYTTHPPATTALNTKSKSSRINEDFKSTFRLDWRVSAVWRDPELSPSAGLFMDDHSFEDMWVTKVFPSDLEGMEEELVVPYCKLLQEKDGAVVRRLARWSSVAKMAFDLRRFPYDAHDLEVSLYTPKTCDKHVKLHIRRVDFAFPDFTPSASGSWVIRTGWRLLDCPSVSTSAPRVSFAIPVTRDPTRWMYNVELMFVLLTGCMIMSLLVPPSNIEFRVEVMLGILLTVFAFKISVDPILPAKGYFNALSSLLFWNLAVCLVLALEAIFLASQQNVSSEQRVTSVIALILISK